MNCKDTIKRMPLFGMIAQTAYSRIKGTWRLNPSYWISRIFLRDIEGVAVQIGSNDGKTGDPLHDWLKKKKGWSAVFVEPVPFLFKRLQQTYSGESRFAFENTVINDGSDVSFFWASPDARAALSDLPAWWDQLGGLSREHIINHIPELEPFIESATLSGISLTNLFERHAIDNIDLLHIDTEGADYKILSQLNLIRFRPRVILYERKHLSEDEHKQSIHFLKNDYELFNLGADMLAINKEAKYAMQTTLKPLRGVRVPIL